LNIHSANVGGHLKISRVDFILREMDARLRGHDEQIFINCCHLYHGAYFRTDVIPAEAGIHNYQLQYRMELGIPFPDLMIRDGIRWKGNDTDYQLVYLRICR
jgi:hypothetical protein